MVLFCSKSNFSKNSIGVFEPVGTHPGHQRKGLCKAMMFHALSLVKNLGCKTAYLSAYGNAEVAFYKTVRFLNYDVVYPWVKNLRSDT